MTPLEKLCKIPEEQSRIDAVAADLPSTEQQYAEIDPWDLADAFSLQLDGPASCMKVTSECSLNDSLGEYPARENLELLNDLIPAARYAQLEAEAEEIDNGTREEDLTIDENERQLMEAALARRCMDDGGGWQINSHTLTATDGMKISFEVSQGDGGDLWDLTGPYEIHRNGWPDHKGLVIGEEWAS